MVSIKMPEAKAQTANHEPIHVSWEFPTNICFWAIRLERLRPLQVRQLRGSCGEGFWASRHRLVGRCPCPPPMPNSDEIAAQDRPWARRKATLEASTTTRGLASFRPLLLARASLERTRSRINSLSNSAMLAKMPNTRRPFGVEVSTPSWRLTKSIPRARNSSRAFTN